MPNGFNMAKRTKGHAHQLGDQAPNGYNGISGPQMFLSDADSHNDVPQRTNGLPLGHDRTGFNMSEGNLKRLDNQTLPNQKPLKHIPIQVNNSSTPYQAGIGVALGSPSQMTHMKSHDAMDASLLGGPRRLGDESAMPNEIGMEALPREKGRWRMFGGLFSKKPVSHPASPLSPPYKTRLQSTTVSEQEPAMTNRHRRASSKSLDSSIAGRIAKPQGKEERHGKVQNKSTASKNSGVAGYAEDMKSPKPPPKDFPSPLYSVKSPGRERMLQVDIPDISMERYSVMFGSVLKPRQSTLMIRRQAQLERLKVNEPTLTEEGPERNDYLLPVRRATVPSPAKSPSLSLFPNMSHQSRPPPTPRKDIPLHRSATAPTISPLRAKFQPPEPAIIARSKALPLVHSPSQSSDTGASMHDHWNSDISPTSTAPSLTDGLEEVQPRKTTQSTIKLPESKYSTLKTSRSTTALSPTVSKGVSLTDVQNPHWKAQLPTNPRPQNKVVNAHTVWQRSTSATGIPRTGNTASNRTIIPQETEFSAAPSGQIVKPNPLQSSPVTAAEISIARQISISRRQQMMIPIVPKTARQPQQAKLVDPEQQDSHVNQKPTREKGHATRKSEHGLLEMA